MTAATPTTSLAAHGQVAFQSTLWSQVLAAVHSDSAGSAQSLNELCRLYWFPLYAYLRRSGQDHPCAKDLTQGFFAYLLEGDVLRKATPDRGRFRSFLLGTLKNFVSHERDKAQAQRRGGGSEIVSIDEQTAEGLYAHEPASNLTPEKLFDRRWALTVLEEAIGRLKGEHERARMADAFEILRPCLTGDGEHSFRELGARLNRSEGAVRVLVCRLRERFRHLIREVIGDTVPDLEQVEAELKHLQAALRDDA